MASWTYNYRICRSRLYSRKKHGEAFRGYIASKRRFFYGLGVHLVTTTSGLPVEVVLAPGSKAANEVERSTSRCSGVCR